MQISLSRYTLTSLLLVAATAVVSYALEAFLGKIALDFFAFPMNVILLGLLAVVIVELYRRGNKSVVTRYLLSTQATITAIVVAVIGCIVAGLQREPSTDSYLFIAMVIFVMSVIGIVTLRGWRAGGAIRWRFLLSHLGLLLVLIGGFWGATDRKILRAEVGSEPTDKAVYTDGRVAALDYSLALTNLDTEYAENGTPTKFCASLTIDNKPFTLEVNSPYSVHFGHDIYLISCGSNSCIVQVVVQPWRGVMVVGIIMLLLGAAMLFLGGAKR